MKTIKRFLAIVCSLALLLSLAVAQSTVADTVESAIFVPDDMSVNELKLYATKDEATEMFGAPDRTEIITWEATGDTFEMWYYEDLTLTFNALGNVISALVYSEKYTGPRGVQVGQSTQQDVIGKFYVDPESTSGSVLYTAGYVEMLDAQLPPCGYVLSNEDGTISVYYVAPTAPFGDDVVADLTNYIYQDLALFTVNFDADGTVKDFSWQVGPWAE